MTGGRGAVPPEPDSELLSALLIRALKGPRRVRYPRRRPRAEVRRRIEDERRRFIERWQAAS